MAASAHFSKRGMTFACPKAIKDQWMRAWMGKSGSKFAFLSAKVTGSASAISANGVGSAAASTTPHFEST